MKDYRKIFLTILVISLPILVFAQTENPIIPCINECNYYSLIQLVNNIINWIIKISIPVAAGVLAWAGFLLMTTGVADKRAEAKGMIKKVFIGLTIILSAWIIVSTILNALLENPNSVPVDLTK